MKQNPGESRKDSDRKFLEKIGNALSESLDYEATIDRVVDLALGFLGDWCSVDLLADDGSVQRVAMAHANPDLVKRIQDVRRRRPGSVDPRFPPARVIKTGEPVYVPQLTQQMLTAMDLTSEIREIVRDLDICSYVAVPLKARGRVLGVLSLIRNYGSRTYDEHDFAFIKEVATQIALHIDNARLFRDAQVAQKQSALLAEITALLAESFDSANILQRLAQIAVTFSDYCIVHRSDVYGRLYRAAGAHANPELSPIIDALLQQELEPEGQKYIQSIIDKNSSHLVCDGGKMISMMSEGPYKEIIKKLGPYSWIVAPLIARGNRLGAILLARSEKTPQYTQSDLHFVEELARRAAIAIDNERLYRESQEASRLKDQFLATVSHELRTPLTTIVGWAAILQKNEVDPKTFEKALASIQRNVRLQQSMVDDLLDVSRIVTGKMRLDMRPVDLWFLVQTAVENMQSAAEAKGIKIEIVPEGTSLPIVCDPDRIQQVLWNLLTNAIKFTPADGGITVTVEPSASNQVEITVTDTGIGVPSEFLPFVFDRFRQYDGSSTRNASGLGLGLSIVKHLVELHGGTVQAESAGAGLGTTLRVVLPRNAGRAASAPTG
jgi:signal transduction histidine kinase